MEAPHITFLSQVSTTVYQPLKKNNENKSVYMYYVSGGLLRRD